MERKNSKKISEKGFSLFVLFFLIWVILTLYILCEWEPVIDQAYPKGDGYLKG